jgi:hypothetical protein
MRDRRPGKVFSPLPLWERVAGGRVRGGFVVGVVFLLGITGKDLSACTVCFGSAGSDWVRGFTWGIVLLAALPPVLFTLLVVLVLHHSRRARL